MSAIVRPASATALRAASMVRLSGSTPSLRPSRDMPMPVIATLSSNLSGLTMGRTHCSGRSSSGTGPSAGPSVAYGEQRQPDVFDLLETDLDPVAHRELLDRHVDDVGGQPDPGILLDGHDADDVRRRHRRYPHVLVDGETHQHAPARHVFGRQIRRATRPADRSGRVLKGPAVGAAAEPQHPFGTAGPEELGLGNEHRQRWWHGGHSMRAAALPVSGCQRRVTPRARRETATRRNHGGD